MESVIARFQENIYKCKNLGQIYAALSVSVTNALDITDLLRAELVLAVSALDYYVHELVRLGMIECISGEREATNAFKKFGISLESVVIALNSRESVDWLENEIRVRHSFKSFQHADKIAEAVRLISNVDLWTELAAIMGQQPRDIKDRLNLIIDRRNKIAHEADMDPSYPGSRWAIDKNMVDNAVDFIVACVQTIDQIVVVR